MGTNRPTGSEGRLNRGEVSEPVTGRSRKRRHPTKSHRCEHPDRSREVQCPDRGRTGAGTRMIVAQ
eukprot:3965324-Alexandrium_andersonii.AAC.1